jgi:UDP-N-acetyl-D-mannosaminuronate dehydrogenase
MVKLEKAVTLVVGLGEVGKPLCIILQKQDPEVIGIDIEPVSVDRPIGILHVCFPFTAPGPFQEAVVSYARKYRPEVIVVNSTVVPGTTRGLEDATGIPFVAGAGAEATERVLEHFKAAGLQAEALSTPEALELAKLLETTYFGMLIAWAQEMNRFAETVNADYLEVGKFFREIAYLPKVLFQPGIIGGHCVMPNIALLQQRFQSDFLDVIKKSNEARKTELAEEQQQPPAGRLQPLALA